MTAVYAPSKRLSAKVSRRLVRFQARRMRPVKLDRPLISFSFDDCPKSVLANGLKPLEAEGWRSTLYIAMGLCGTTNHLGLHMSAADVKAAQTSGHEIGDHTYSHGDSRAMPLDRVLSDIDRNQAALNALDIPASETFAYPFGETTPALKKSLETRFRGARGIIPANQSRDVDLNQIGSNCLYTGSHFETVIETINALSRRPGWLTLFTHDVRDTPSPFGCTPAQMRQVITAVKSVNAEVMPVIDAIKHLETHHDP